MITLWISPGELLKCNNYTDGWSTLTTTGGSMWFDNLIAENVRDEIFFVISNPGKRIDFCDDQQRLFVLTPKWMGWVYSYRVREGEFSVLNITLNSLSQPMTTKGGVQLNPKVCNY